LSLLQKPLSTFQNPVAFCPHFEAKYDAVPLFLQVGHFWRYIRITNVTTHTCTNLYITTHYSAITCATVPFPTGNDSADSIYILLAAAVSFHSQSRNYLITPCIYQNIKIIWSHHVSTRT
jgi:hypothetical protein